MGKRLINDFCWHQKFETKSQTKPTAQSENSWNNIKSRTNGSNGQEKKYATKTRIVMRISEHMYLFV